MAIYKSVKGLGWFVGGVVVALGCYTITSRVAAARDRLDSIDQSIASARADLRILDAEFNTRANFAQLQRWNGEIMRLSAPTSGQIVSSEVALAQFNRNDADQPQVASYIVPEAPAASVEPEGIPINIPVAAITAGSGARTSAPPVASVSRAAAIDVVPVMSRKRAPTQAIAMLDTKGLRDTSFSDLLRGTPGGGLQ